MGSQEQTPEPAQEQPKPPRQGQKGVGWALVHATPAFWPHSRHCVHPAGGVLGLRGRT